MSGVGTRVISGVGVQGMVVTNLGLARTYTL